MAEYEGLFVSDSIKQPKVTTKELRKLVMKNDVDGLKQKMFNANSKTINDLVGLAKKAYDKLNMSTINFIEKTYKVSLKPVNLDG
jgi:hypothetical protein